MARTIGFIGYGNMGSAIINGILSQEVYAAKQIFVSDISTQKLGSDAAKLGFTHTDNTRSASCDILLLAVKPNIMKTILEEIQPVFNPQKQLLISIAVGLPISFYKAILGDNLKIIRAMPNTPVAVGAGMTALCCETPVTQTDIDIARQIFDAIGRTEIIDEYLMNTVSALSGSGPALVDMFIEALADGAVRHGLSRKMAYDIAAQTLIGSAKLMQESGQHPGVLKDQVCSPGGTTIEAVAALEKHGFRFALIDALEQCIQKAQKIS